VEPAFAQRLEQAVAEKGNAACVGIDPVIERMPAVFRDQVFAETRGEIAGRADAMRSFGRVVLDLVAPLVPVVKINIAFFETAHERGIRAYRELVAEARAKGLIVIGDVKRADIGHTSAAYAQAMLSSADDEKSASNPDAVTINPYFGLDGVAPFLEIAGREGKGVFVLVHTSNSTADEVQGQILEGGGTVRFQKV